MIGTNGAALVALLTVIAGTGSECGEKRINQYFLYKCKRCGATSKLVPNSGFFIDLHITRTQVLPLPLFNVAVTKSALANSGVSAGTIDDSSKKNVTLP